MRLPLIGGSYTSRSVIASAQRCINYYSEINPKSAIVPVTHYQRPGLDPVANIGPGPIRGLFRASNEVGYAVSGNGFYLINPDFTGTGLGTLGTSVGPVSMTDNGTDAMLVDGSTTGYTTRLGTTSFATISDPSETFQGADQVEVLDTYMMWNMPKSVFMGTTFPNSLTFSDIANPNGLFGGKTTYPDFLKGLYVNRREIFLFGDVKTEIWYNSGPTTESAFSFSPLPGVYVEHGIAAPFSRASHDITVYWLSKDKQGEGVVLSFRGYFANRISNHALEDAIRKMQKTVGIADALGFAYQLDGHQFYMLTFPKGNQTWVYDGAIQDPNAAWHQECWFNPADSSLNRSRVNCIAFINDRIVAGDWENSTLYSLNLDKYTDRVMLNKTDTSTFTECPIVFIRSFPHIGAARQAGGTGMMEIDGRRLQFSAFRADMECGTAPLDANGQPAQVSLRWSDDRGFSFGNAVLQQAGAPGEYLTQPQWLGMGVARDRIFEISHNIAGPAALNGAWVDAEVLGT